MSERLTQAQEILSKFSDDLTPQQLKYLREFVKTPSFSHVALEYCVSESTVRRCLNNLFHKFTIRKSTVPEHMDIPIDEPFFVEKFSANYGADGQRKQHWIKAKMDAQQMYESMKAAIEDLVLDLPKLPSRGKGDQHADSDLLATYPLGDPHIGLLTYAPEVDQNWDLKIAEKKFLPLFDKLVKSAEPCKEALIIDLGDFWHYDAMDQRTTRSGHKVDADGRPSKMVEVGFRIMRRMIESALDVHETVKVIILPGNHDDLGSIFLRIALAHIYENEPRVKISTSPGVFQYHSWGKNLLGFHHGDKCKLSRLPMVMASDRPALWGKSEFRKWLIGHFHTDSERSHRGVEMEGCKVESFRTIVPNEGYAHEAGYRKAQDGKCLVLHKKYGEITRHTVNLSQIR